MSLSVEDTYIGYLTPDFPHLSDTSKKFFNKTSDYFILSTTKQGWKSLGSP